jgi:hypothetical protein
MVIQSAMVEIAQLQDHRRLSPDEQPPQEILAAENLSLRLLLAQAEIDALRTKLIKTPGRQLKGDVELTYETCGFAYVFGVTLASLTAIGSE